MLLKNCEPAESTSLGDYGWTILYIKNFLQHTFTDYVSNYIWKITIIHSGERICLEFWGVA